jgi:hypothetical protein
MSSVIISRVLSDKVQTLFSTNLIHTSLQRGDTEGIGRYEAVSTAFRKTVETVNVLASAGSHLAESEVRMRVN